MFGIWTSTGLPPSPTKHNLYPFAKLGSRCEYVCSNMSFGRKKDLGKDRLRVCVQEDSGCDVPGQEVEQLVLVQDLTEHLAFLEPFLLLLRKKRGGHQN